MVLRKFRDSDAEKIISWIRSEREFRLWCADRYEDYPIVPGDIKSNYAECAKNSGFVPLTAADEDDNAIGHLILRYTNDLHEEVRFGFVIVADSLRGKGVGRQMLELAKAYAVEKMNAKRLSLGVFDVNHAALNCYRSAGFSEISDTVEFFETLGEKWKCIELGMTVI